MIAYLLAFSLSAFSGFAATNTGIGGSLTQKPLTAQPNTNPQMPNQAGPTSDTPTLPRDSVPSNPNTEFQRSTALEIAFEPGRSDLGADTKAKLNELLRDAHRRGQVDEIKVIGWGDISYPPSGGEKAPKGQLDLARDRNRSIENYLLKGNNGIEIHSYNMAERPTALQELLKTSQAKVKDALEARGLAGKNANRGSRAIVMVILR
jgi:hypothetical protein